ncbi:MAG: polyribonucleotide nucleotidyltransferase, partial [Bacteroidales bacterium]|nr:polyribonucleotide nucleotidyltransferase [Bacteroidales bacterium]
IRPLFPDDFHAEVQVQVTLISGDRDVAPDAYAALAASAALSISDIPFHGPISEVRVSQIDGKMVINPSIADQENATLEFMVAADMKNIVMVEGEAKEISEDTMIESLKFAHEAIKTQCEAISKLVELAGKEKFEYCHETNDEELHKAMQEYCYGRCYDVAKSQTANKKLRTQMFDDVKTSFEATLTEEELEEKQPMINRYYAEIQRNAVRNFVLDTNSRIDGRQPDEIRPIWCITDYLPAAHGSAVFTRGETQSLSAVTLGTKLDEQTIDGAIFERSDKFILHYNFPSFATGEVKAAKSISRREIGHGNLALRALKNMIPEDCPYTIRVVSDILESNGSSSMATVCAGTLALLDSGVKMKKPVSGIAMGMISDENRHVVLSDILGDEDHLGDMDFKVTGTADGITACQMDLKIDGLPYDVLAAALQQAKQGRLHILDIIHETIPAPRADYKEFVPRIDVMTIDKECIGAVIGQGGKVIQEIQSTTNTTIVIEEENNVGVVTIYAPDLDSINNAKLQIERIIAKPEIGTVYHGVVKSILEFGAFVEFLPNKDGLLHVSEIAWERLDDVNKVLKVGDEIDVKLIEIDTKTGKFRLSRKALLPKPEGYVEHEKKERKPGNNNNNNRQNGNNKSNNNNRNHNNNSRNGNHNNNNHRDE